jgi:segregation and condensation protein A
MTMASADPGVEYGGPPISLSIFQGPLDLLAYLVRTQQVDVQELAVSEVVSQFVAFVRTMQILKIEEAAEFLPVAAALVLWKVRSLLPREEGEEPQPTELADALEEVLAGPDARLEEYRAFRQAAEQLREAHSVQQQVFLRSLDEEEAEGGWVSLDQVSIFDMVSALSRVLERADQETAPVVLRPRWSVRTQMKYVLDRLRETSPMAFEDLFEAGGDKLWIVTTFLALLELIRRGMARVQLGAGRAVMVTLVR